MTDLMDHSRVGVTHVPIVSPSFGETVTFHTFPEPVVGAAPALRHEEEDMTESVVANRRWHGRLSWLGLVAVALTFLSVAAGPVTAARADWKDDCPAPWRTPRRTARWLSEVAPSNSIASPNTQQSRTRRRPKCETD